MDQNGLFRISFMFTIRYSISFLESYRDEFHIPSPKKHLLCSGGSSEEDLSKIPWKCLGKTSGGSASPQWSIGWACRMSLMHPGKKNMLTSWDEECAMPTSRRPANQPTTSRFVCSSKVFKCMKNDSGCSMRGWRGCGLRRWNESTNVFMYSIFVDPGHLPTI